MLVSSDCADPVTIAHFTAFVIALAAARAAPTLGKTHESVPGSTLFQP
jgi:hypothetical protein